MPSPSKSECDKAKHPDDYIDSRTEAIIEQGVKINMRKGFKAAIVYINREIAKLQKEILKGQ
jgi:hypothetical protein